MKSKLPSLVALSFALMLASCGSYQYVGYDSDGIYDDQVVIYQEETAPVNTNDNSEYKDFFNDKSQQYETLPQEDVIFTDIDSYSSSNYNGDQLYADETMTGNAGWGENNTQVVINYRNTGWNNWGFNSPWGYGLGYGGFGWGNGFGWGFNNPWRFGMGWGYGGFYDPYWCPPYYGYGFGWNYYNRYAFNNYNRYVYYGNNTRRGYAYNGRVNNDYYRNTSIRDRSSRNVNGRNSSRYDGVRNGTTVRDRRTTNYGTSIRNRTNSSTRSSRSSNTYGTPSRVRTSSPTRNSGTSVRRSSSTRSSSPAVRTRTSSPRTYSPSRSSSSGSRSSSATRSSGSSSRSSGSTRSSGGRRGGR